MDERMADGNSIFTLFAQRMSWLKQRNEVLAQNVANADTLDYAPKDLTEESFSRVLEGTRSAAATVKTSGGHLAGTLEDGKLGNVRPSEATYETAPSGNAVDLEEQLVKVAETQMNHSTVTNLYNKYVAMFRTAIGTGR